MISPCVPTSQSSQLPARSKPRSSDTPQVSEGSSRDAIGEKRESRSALCVACYVGGVVVLGEEGLQPRSSDTALLQRPVAHVCYTQRAHLVSA